MQLADVKQSSVYLSWVTATELNNKGFEIERKVIGDKSSVIGNWEKIGFVQGNGTTTEQKSYSFVDNKVSSGTYSYRLKQIDYDGTYKYSKEIGVSVNVPLKFSLSQNYPNPFNPTTQIKYSLPDNSTVNISVYNVIGQKIQTLIDKVQKGGEYEVTFKGSKYPSGIYFCRMEARSVTTGEDYHHTIKMALVK
jgi:Secretion system C-terminal sorting domain